MKIRYKLNQPRKKVPVFFTGAGISYYSNLPLANNLKYQIAADLFKQVNIPEINSREVELQERIKSLMLEGILELFSKQVPGITSQFSRVFLGANPTEYHFALAYLLITNKIEFVITTNFDDLIEQAFEILRKKLNIKSKLYVVFNEKKATIVKSPTLIKIHGCARHPETLVFNLRQVGVGLDKWKLNLLKNLSRNPFVFLGYSDQDKDLTPILSNLKNNWYWVIHNYIPLKEQLSEKKGLLNLLNSKKRVIVFCDAKSEVLEFTSKLTKKEFKCDIDYGKFNWEQELISILNKISLPKKISICGDLLYDLLGEVKLAEKTYKKGLTLRNVSLLTRLSYETKLNVVYGNNWDTKKLEKRLNYLKSKYKNIKIPKQVSATLSSQWASLYYYKSIEFSKLSEKYYLDEEKICEKLKMIDRKYYSIINQAVVLQRRGDFVKAENKYIDCIPKIKEFGNIILLAKSITNYSSLLIELNKPDIAIQNLNDSLALLNDLGEELWRGRLICNLGLAFRIKGQVKVAKNYFEECEKIFEKHKDSYWIETVKQALKGI